MSKETLWPFHLQLFAEGGEGGEGGGEPETPKPAKIGELGKEGLSLKSAEELIGYIIHLRGQNTKLNNENKTLKDGKETAEKTLSEREQKDLTEKEDYKKLFENEKAAREKAETDRVAQAEAFAQKRRTDALILAAKDAGIHAPEDASRYAEEYGFADVKEKNDEIVGADKVIEKMKAAKPYLFKVAEESTQENALVTPGAAAPGSTLGGALGSTGVSRSVSKPAASPAQKGGVRDFSRASIAEMNEFEAGLGIPLSSSQGSGVNRI